MSPDRRFVRSVAIVVFVVLAGFGLVRFSPPLPSPLTLQIALPADRPGEIEPIVITGVFGAGDFLFVRYVDHHTVVFTYDSWGVGGPTSPPVTVEPGTWHTLQIKMPSLSNPRGTFAVDGLCVRFDGTTILQAETSFHHREPEQVYFAKNPIHNNSNPDFHGVLRTPDGRSVRGTDGFQFSLWRDRLLGWVIHAPWQLLCAVLIGAAAGFAAAPVVRWFRTRPAFLFAPWRDRSVAGHRWFLATTVLCALAFAAVSTSGTFRLIYPESFGNFYEYQAASLLQGRLDVPPGVLSGETFIVGGKHYGYFGVTPALLRIPFVVFDVGFGQLSRSFMLADYVACLLAAYLLLRFVWQSARGPAAAPPVWAVVLLTLNAGGSSLFFLSSRAFIYHEAILCGATFGLFSSYCTLRYLAAPERRWWLGALVCGTLAVHARPPAGLFALALLGSAAAVTLVRTYRSRPANPLTGKRQRWPDGWGRHVGIGLLSVLGVLSFNAQSYLKFKSFDGAPLKYHVQYNAARLARIDGKNFHLGNLHRNLDAYLLRPLWIFRPTFPYVYAGDPAPRPYPGSKIDVGEPILGLPYAMPALFALAAVGLTAAFWRHAALRPALLSLGLAAVPLTLALATAVATSHRYTADFCPFLLGAAACGCLAVDDLTRRWRAPALALLGVLTVAALLIILALTLHYQGEGTWGVPDNVMQDYQKLRLRVDQFFHLPPHAPH
jgi:hypothetical protein